MSFDQRNTKVIEKVRKPNAKVRNPCKICGESVNNKTGLQCKGACKKWAHFDCLNYPPGQIEDIRCGFLKINCPCPDCENDVKVFQSNLNREPDSVKSRECSRTFCPGVPNVKSPLSNCNFPAVPPKPVPFGINEGTSYEYIGNVTTEESHENEFENEQVYNEQTDIEQTENDQDECDSEEVSDRRQQTFEQRSKERLKGKRRSDIIKHNSQQQIVASAKSSLQLAAAVCCGSPRVSPVSSKKGGVNTNIRSPIKSSECCANGPCSTSSSSSSSSGKSGKKKGKKKVKVKEKKEKTENKGKKKKKDKKVQKDKKVKKVKKEKTSKKKKKVGKGDKGKQCCRTLKPCCQVSNESCVSCDSSCSSSSSTTSSGSAKSAKSTKSNRSTQAPCGEVKSSCPRSGASSPVKLVKQEGCCTDGSDIRGPARSPQGRGFRGRLPTPYPIPRRSPGSPTDSSYDSRPRKFGNNSPRLRYGGRPIQNPSPPCGPYGGMYGNYPPMPGYNQPNFGPIQRPYPISNPNCPPIMPQQLQQLQRKPESIPNCPPACHGMAPMSKCPPNCPGPGGGRQGKQPGKGDKCGACLPGCCDPSRPKQGIQSGSTQLLCLSAPTKSTSCSTLNRRQKKEATSTFTQISAHMVQCSKSDTKLHHRRIEEYNRKMLLLALERMCQTMGQFSVQFRELMNKMADTLDGKR